MKHLAIFILIPLAFAACAGPSEAGQDSERKSGRIIAESIPACLHIGDVVEALVLVDANGESDILDLAVSSQKDLVSTTPKLARDLSAPTAIIFRGEKFGTDIVTLSVPGRPDIKPLTAEIRVLPSFEPPQDLITHPTEQYSHGDISLEIDPKNIYRHILFKWQPKEGVKDYGIQVFDFRRNFTQSFMVGKNTNRAVTSVVPDQHYVWRLRAIVDSCVGGKIWSHHSPLIPFDS